MKGNKDKEAFRCSKEWKDFRKRLLLERGTYCACCGKKTKFLDLHHMDEEHYTDLDPDKFVFVCKLCHKCISALEQIKPENRKKIRKPDWADFFGRFLST